MKKTLTVIILALAVTAWAATTPPAPVPVPSAGPKVAPPASSTNAPSVFTRGYNNLTGLFKEQVKKDLATEYYTGGKLDLNLSATYSAVGGSDFGQLWTSDFKHGVWGANLGSMFWISKYFGTGVELGLTDINNPGSWLFDYGAVDAAVRYPIGRVAPYIVGTAGRNFDASTYFYGVGPGISFALTERAKLFTDARFIWQQDEAQNGLLARFGLTISF